MIALEFTLLIVSVFVIIFCLWTMRTLLFIWANIRKAQLADGVRCEEDVGSDDRPTVMQDPFAPLNRACCQVATAYHLSPREEEMLPYFARGKSCTSIAEELHIGSATVKTHSSNIYQKLGIHSRDELIVLVERQLTP